MVSGTGAHAAGHAMQPYAATWRITFASLAIVWSIVLLVYAPTAISMAAKWDESGTFAHGFLIPPITLYLLWRARRPFFRHVPAPSLWVGILMALAGLVWLIGDLGSVLVIQQAALVAILELVLCAVVGFRAAWAFAFPLVFFWFVVPIGEFLVGPMQDFTAWFAVNALRLSGVPVLWEGRALTIPTGYWLVAEACSGVRYIIPSIVLGVLYAWLTYHSWQRRSAFVALSIIVPIVANGMRAYAIIILAHLTQNRIAVGIDHLIYGWVFFAVIILLLFLIGGRWREAPMHPVVRAGPLPDDESSSVTARLPVTAALVGMLAVCPPLLSATVFADVSGTPLRPLAPNAMAPWTPTTTITWKPAYAGADTELIKSYAADHRVVQLYVAYYANERQGAELVNADNRVDDGKQWRLIGSQIAHARLGSALLPVREETIRSHSGHTRLAWTWYWVAGQYTLSPVEAKLLKVKSRLLRRPYEAAAVVLATEHAPNFPAQPVLQDFLDHCPTCDQLVQGNGSSARH